MRDEDDDEESWDEDDVDDDGDGDDYDDGDEDGDEDTMPCPYCGATIYDDAVRCPKCDQYLSDEERTTTNQPRWIIVTALIVIAALVWAYLG